MGKTLSTTTEFFQKIESRLSLYRKALRREDQLLLDQILANARKHLSAISESGTPLPFELMLLSMLLEQQKQIEALKTQLAPQKKFQAEKLPPWMDHVSK